MDWPATAVWILRKEWEKIMNRSCFIALSAVFFISPSFAANWLELQNSEPAGASSYTVWGFIQPQYVRNFGGAVSGVAAPAPLQAYNGKAAVFNQVGPDLAHGDQLQVFRARPGVRGVVPGSAEKINYFILGEIGNNGLTRERHAVLTDASVTFNYLPGARVRVGLGRLPLGEEAFQGIQALDFINFTNVTDNLLNERFVVPYKAGRVTAPVLGVPMASAGVTGPVSGFQDVGVEVFDWWRRENWEYSYAVLFGQGNGITFSGVDGSRDVVAHLRAAYVFGGKGVKREEVMAYAWRQEGKRAFGAGSYERIREGLGFRYAKNPWRVSGETMRGKGMIFVGPTPPFNDVGGGAFEPVTLVALDSANRADGYYLDLGWKIHAQWELDLRFDRYNRLTNSAFDEREFSTSTLGMQYFYSPRTKLGINYEIRSLKVPHPGAAGLSGTAQAQQIQRYNASLIGDTLGNRLSVQLTYVF